MRALLLAFLLAAQDQPPKNGAISGSVANASTGAPLTKVEVLLETADNQSTFGATTTDAKGNFTLADIPPGRYRLKGSRNAYLDTYLGAHRPGANGTVINLEPGQELKDLQVKLFPFGVISGTVRDTDGEPLVGVNVKLFRQKFVRVGHRVFAADATATTDDLGQYRVPNLEPGKYFVLANRPGDEDYGANAPADRSSKSAEPPAVILPTLYPGTIDPAAARAVEVGPGGRVSGADVVMVRSRVYRVTVHAAVPQGWGGQSVWLDTAPGYEGLELRLRGMPGGAADVFEIRGVPPGAYTLRAKADPAVKARPQQPGVIVVDFFRRSLEAHMPLTVTGNMEGVRIAVTSGSEVSGRVTSEQPDEQPKPEPKPESPPATVTLSSDDGGVTFDSSSVFDDSLSFVSRTGAAEIRLAVNADHTFTAALPPDRYHVQAMKPGFVVKSIRADGVDIYADGLTLAEGAKPSIEIVLAKEGGQVDGLVLDKDEKPAAGATVLLVAEPKLRSRSDAFQATTADQHGRYHFDTVRAGSYKVFAWDDLEDQAWFDPDFLKDVEDKGEPVTLAAKGHGGAQVHILPAR
jgi:protocatechuate 3,4-dioxygenase beta subunit